jgi:hypothetical protein
MIGTNKRIIEVQKDFKNRPYNLKDKKRLNLFQLLFGILSIVTFFFYCIDPSKSQLFNNGYFLYINLILIILIIGNFLFFQKKIDQDIVVFIYSNKINFILVTIFFILFIRNSAFF